MNFRKRTKKLLFVGPMTLDTYFYIPSFESAKEGKYLAQDSYEATSGMAINAAITANFLGSHVSVWSKIGNDRRGNFMMNELGELGISLEHIAKDDNQPSAYATVIVGSEGKRWVTVNNTNILDKRSEIADLPDFTQYCLVMADVRWPLASKIALSSAKLLSKPAVLDADVVDRKTLLMLSAHSTHILASSDAAYTLTGILDAAAATEKLYEQFKVFCCVTDGSNGCYYRYGSITSVQHVASPQIRAIDTNGAGDVFHGAFCYGLSEGFNELKALKFAVVAAALKCQQKGARLNMITTNDILKYLETFYK